MHKTRKIIFSAFALGGLVLGCTAANNAWANTAKLLEADSNWSVTKIDAKDTKRGEAYCALARRFDENIILTFARNGHNEGSVALDLQKQHWNPLREYNVVLMGGYGENRSFDIKPETSGAIVVRLGEDLSFFDALGRSETLEMRVNDEAYKFALSDLLGGQKKLNECLVNLPMAEKVEKAGVEDSVSPSQQDRAGEVTKQIENLRQENLRLRNALERERRAYENRFMSESVDSSAVSELSEKARLLEIENGKLHTQLSRLKENMASGEEAVCKAAADEESKKKQDAALAVLQKENARLKASLASQAKRLALLESGTVKDKKESTDTQAVKKDNVKADMEMLKKVRLQEEEIAILRGENEALKNELAQIRLVGEDQRINISSANWNLEKATRRFNEAEREIRRLGDILEDERAKCAREKREIEYMLFDPEIAKKEQTARLVELEKELDKAKDDLKRTKDTYKDRIEYLEQELASAQKPRAPAPESRPVAAIKKEKVPVVQNVKPEDILMAERTSTATVPPAVRISAEEESRINEEIKELEEERKELLRRVSRLQQENSRLQAESYRQAQATRQPQPQPQPRPQSIPPTQSVSSVPAIAESAPATSTNERNMLSNDGAPSNLRQGREAQNKTDVSRPPQQIRKENMRTPAPVGEKPAPQKNIAYMSANDLEAIFRQGGIDTNDGVHRIDVGNNIVAHSWTSGQMFGSSEQSEMDFAGQYDSFVTRYLGKTEGRCPGEFASAASQEKQIGSIRASAYEIACIGDNNAASAAILFFNKDGVFTAIAHETGVDAMDIAMDTRDKLFEILTGNTNLSQRR